MELRLDGQNAVITGAGRGLGKAIAMTLAEAGANILVGDIDQALAEKTVEEIKALGRKSSFQPLDVAKPAQVAELMRAARETLGKIDIVVNVAGVIVTEPFMEAPYDKVKWIMDINILGTDYVLREALKVMIPQKSGKILAISSTAGREKGGNLLAHYKMTKAAVLNLTQAASEVGAPHGIRVNAICPGIIRTDMWEAILTGKAERTHMDREELWQKAVAANIPLGVAQEPEDIANAALFLLSDKARYITGQALNVCGGMSKD